MKSRHNGAISVPLRQLQRYLLGMSDTINLWSARPGMGNSDAYAAMLSQAETDRAARYKFAADSDAFVTAHGLRRQVIAGQIGVLPGDLRFDRTAKGRPTLASPHAKPFAFSASRRRNLVAVATGPVQYLGVDVENVAPIADHEQVLSTFLDAASLALLTGPNLEQTFAQLWTITEACAKARGTGLETFSPRLSVRLEAVDLASIQDGTLRWKCHLLAPDDQHRIAVAYDAPDWLSIRQHLSPMP